MMASPAEPLEYTPCECGFWQHWHVGGWGPNFAYPLSRCMAFRPRRVAKVVGTVTGASAASIESAAGVGE